MTITSFEYCLRGEPEDPAVHVDLREASFVDPYALVAMACLAESASLQGKTLMVASPTDRSVANYLARMDFGRFLATHCPEATVDLPDVHHSSREDVLVELQSFSAASNLNPLADILFNRLERHLGPQVLSALLESFHEMADNTRYHSQARGGVVAAQVYRRGTPDERISLAIGDAGIGIRSSLTASGRYQPVDDETAIELALTEHVSAIDDPGRGVGLPTTAETVRTFGGKMTVRSGAGSRTIYSTGIEQSMRCREINGTVVGVEMPCH